MLTADTLLVSVFVKRCYLCKKSMFLTRICSSQFKKKWAL